LRDHNVLRDTIRQRCQEHEHRDERDEVNAHRNPGILVYIRSGGGHPPHPRSRYGDRVVNRLAHDEVEHAACDERRAKMRGEVVVQEQLAVHQIEGEVMKRPGDEEEAG